MRTRRIISRLLLLALLGVMPALARAQEGPIVLGRREKSPILTLDPFTGAFSLTALGQYQKTFGNNQNTESNDLLFQQTVSLGSSGAIVSRNLFDWHASATIGAQEEWTHSPSQDQYTLGDIITYNLGASIIEATPFPISVYARQGQSYVQRSYSSTLQNTDTVYGANIAWRNTIVPMSLSISHNQTVQKDLSGNTNYTLDQDMIEYQASYQDEHHDSSLDYNFNGINQNNPGLIDNVYDLNNLSASDNWSLDPEGRYTLTTYLSLANQTGPFAYTNYRFSELLRMRHTPSFETSLSYTYDQQSYNASESRTNSVNGGFTHRLFESFTTTGLAGASFTNNEFSGAQLGSSDSNTYFANLGFNYNKKVPLGNLNAHLALGISQTDNGPVGTTQEVIGQQRTFTDPIPIILTQPGISPTSIAVFDITGTRQFVENVDYTVDTVGNTVQIHRVVGGDIADGQAVKLNYDIVPLPGYISTTANFATGLRYDFQEGPLNGLGVYVNYAQQNQEINPPSSQITADDINDLIFGAEYRVWKLNLRAEQEFRQSSLAPFDALRLTAVYSDRISDRTILSLAAAQIFVRYPNDNSTDNLTNFDVRLDYQIQRDLHAIFRGQWRYEDNSLQGVSTGFDDSFELRWKIRQTDLFFMLRHSALDSFGTNNNNVFFQVGFTRNF